MRIYLFILMLGVSISIFFTSCKKEIVQPTQVMQQKLYTKEGKEYIVKTISNFSRANYLVPTALFKRVYINNAAIATIEACSIVNNSKSIIPISFSASALDINTGIQNLDISNCYYFVESGAAGNAYPAYRKALGKAYPYIERIFYTDANNCNFIIRYNDIIFSNDDFISPADSLTIFFTTTLGAGMATGNQENPFIPAGNQAITTSFTYLELQ